MNNIFKNIPKELPEELIEILAEKNNIKIERIISRNHSTPADFWYDQDTDEFVLLLEGEATLQYDNDKTEKLQKGDYCIIPAHKKHRVKDTDKNQNTIWLAVHF